MAFKQINEDWIPLQIKVFTRWVSNQITNKKGVEITNIVQDLNDGVILIELAKQLTKAKTPRSWIENPNRKIDMVQNCDLAIEMFKKDGVKVVGISGKDINDGKEKLILGLIWSLILRYSITKSINTKVNSIDKLKRKDSEESLKNWAISRTSNYPNIENFQPYDLAMCALLDSYFPDKINFYKLDPKDSTNNSMLVEKVMKELGIPILVDSDEMRDEKHNDEKSFLTQLSSVKEKLESLQIPNQNQHRINLQKSMEMSTMSFGLMTSTEESFNNVNAEVDKIVEETNLKVAKILEKYWPSEREFETENEEEETDEESEFDSNLENTTYQTEKDSFLVPHEEQTFSEIEGDNIQFEGRKFGLVMHMNDLFGDVTLAVTMVKDNLPFLNPAGIKLDVSESNIENNINQQFVFGKNEWNTVVDSVTQQGMVWDVADPENLNPPAGTPFYLFPFHGRHNQHFVYKNEMIYAKQNGMVVTYVGGEYPFQMMPVSEELKSRQTFQIKLLSF